MSAGHDHGHAPANFNAAFGIALAGTNRACVQGGTPNVRPVR
jgi:hypothetical protein